MLNRRSFLKTVGVATAETVGGRNLPVVAETQGEATEPATIPGTPEEPVRVLNGKVDLDRHDGGLSPAIGVELIQVMRANRTHPEWAEGFGFTYNHAPMICYWNGKFHVEWLSNTYGEQLPPGHTLVTRRPLVASAPAVSHIKATVIAARPWRRQRARRASLCRPSKMTAVRLPWTPHTSPIRCSPKPSPSRTTSSTPHCMPFPRSAESQIGSLRSAIVSAAQARTRLPPAGWSARPNEAWSSCLSLGGQPIMSRGKPRQSGVKMGCQQTAAFGLARLAGVLDRR